MDTLNDKESCQVYEEVVESMGESTWRKVWKSNSEADTIAKIRNFIVIQVVVTNCFIIAGNIRHWNDTAPIIINYECIRD